MRSRKSHRCVRFILLLLLLVVARDAASFVLVTKRNYRYISHTDHHPNRFNGRCNIRYSRRIQIQRKLRPKFVSPSSLSLLLDVPDDFFTITFSMLGILLSISKNFARIRMEERAWEQRLEEGREEYLSQNPLVTEYDLRKKEAAQEWSAYGVPRQEQRAAAQRYQADDQMQRDDRRRNRVSVMDRDLNDDYADGGVDDTKQKQRVRKEEYCMTDEEIEMFENEYGVLYDPYYDDPYYVEELPEGKYEVDKLYGDRIYPNGEIFYKDNKTGLFYRQGSKPRNLSFFG